MLNPHALRGFLLAGATLLASSAPAWSQASVTLKLTLTSPKGGWKLRYLLSPELQKKADLNAYLSNGYVDLFNGDQAELVKKNSPDQAKAYVARLPKLDRNDQSVALGNATENQATPGQAAPRVYTLAIRQQHPPKDRALDVRFELVDAHGNGRIFRAFNNPDPRTAAAQPILVDLDGFRSSREKPYRGPMGDTDKVVVMGSAQGSVQTITVQAAEYPVAGSPTS